MLADLDAALRRLLESELAEHGFDGARVSFEAPTNQWAAGLTAPTVDLFLYDLREATDEATGGWNEHRGNGPARLERPALRLECSYAVTAWTREAEDEHRLLSQTLAVLLAHTRLPDQRPGRAARRGDRRRRADHVADRPAEERPQGRVLDRGRRALSRLARLRGHARRSCPASPSSADRRCARTPCASPICRGGRSAFERHRCGGIVRSADGQPGDRRLARAARGRGVGVLRPRRALRLRRRAGRHAPVRVPDAGRHGRRGGASWCPAAASSSRSSS